MELLAQELRLPEQNGSALIVLNAQTKASSNEHLLH